jgi:hypothetical protein
VAGVLKAAGEFGAGLHLAAFELVDGAAGVALEVVVVGLAGYFVAGGVAGDVDWGEPLVIDQAADVAVDGGDAEGVYLFLSQGEGFVGREGAIRLEEGGADGVFLAGVAGLDRGWHEHAWLASYRSVLRRYSQLGGWLRELRWPIRSCGMGLLQLDNLHQEQDEDDEQDEADAASAVVAEARSHAITAKAEHQNQNEQKDKHLYFFSVRRNFARWRCDADFVAGVIENSFAVHFAGTGVCWRSPLPPPLGVSCG